MKMLPVVKNKEEIFCHLLDIIYPEDENGKIEKINETFKRWQDQVGLFNRTKADMLYYLELCGSISDKISK